MKTGGRPAMPEEGDKNPEYRSRYLVVTPFRKARSSGREIRFLRPHLFPMERKLSGGIPDLAG